VGAGPGPFYWPAPLILTTIWLAFAWALYWPTKAKNRRRARPRT